MTVRSHPTSPVDGKDRTQAQPNRTALQVTTMARLRSLTRTRGLLLFLILGCATGLRLYGLDREGFWGDEYLQVQLYRLPLHYTIMNAIARHAFGPPDFVIGWLTYRLDPSVWMCRLPSAIWGMASVGLCFLLGRRLISFSGGLLAAGLLASCPLHLVLSQEARPYSICTAFMLLTMLLLLRCLDQPSTRRLGLYALVAVACAMTRSFIPCVFLAVIGVVVTGMLIAPRHIGCLECTDAKKTRAMRRVWLATMVAGAVSLVWVAVLLAGVNIIPGTLQSLVHGGSNGGSTAQNPYALDLSLIGQWTRNGRNSLAVVGANFGPVATSLIAIGAAMLMVRWQKLSHATKCGYLIMALVGPAVTFFYGFVGGTHLFYDRYNFYLMPIGALLAAYPLSLAIAVIGRTLGERRAASGLATVVLIGLAFAHPVQAAWQEAHSFRRIDWQGCAAFLADRITSDDVVVVLTDAPFGRVQPPFYGKFEWTREQRPLGEAAWTLATSDTHFERLLRQRGNVYAAVAREVLPQSKASYLTDGVMLAPAGFELVKFRGLDLMIPTHPDAKLPRQVVSLCDALATLPLANPSARLIPMTLKTRVLISVNEAEQAQATHKAALALVPASKAEWFNHATASWRDPPS